MTIVKDVDLAAFRKAGEKAYETLKIMDAQERRAQGDRQEVTSRLVVHRGRRQMTRFYAALCAGGAGRRLRSSC